MKLFIKLDNPVYKFCPSILRADQHEHVLVTYRSEIVRTFYDIRYDLSDGLNYAAYKKN